MSIMNYRETKLDRNQARKKIQEIVTNSPENIHFSNHSIVEMGNDNLSTIDVWNVLSSGSSRILDEGECVNGSYRYRLETNFLMTVIAFSEDGNELIIVTVWDKRKREV